MNRVPTRAASISNIFLDSKYKPLSFVSMEIKTSSKALATPSMVQHVATTKLVSPLRGGTCLEIIPLLV
jgi:hypothetical protein